MLTNALTYDLAIPMKRLPLSKYLIVWLCWGKIMPNRLPKYNVSYFQVLVCIHLDLISQRYCGIPVAMIEFNCIIIRLPIIYRKSIYRKIAKKYCSLSPIKFRENYWA